MKRFKYLLYVLLIFLPVKPTKAQSPADYWYYSNQKGLHFDGSNLPTLLTNGQTSGSNWWEMEPYSTISDGSGNLMFYAYGTTIWDQDHAVMINGTGLKCQPSSTQGVLIVPKPGSSTLFYVFTSNSFTGSIDGLYYSIVDMSLAGNGTVSNPKGEVTSTKNIHLLSYNSEKMSALATKDGDSVWILTHAYGTVADPNTSTTTDVYGDNFYAWLLTASGLEGIETANPTIPVISTIGTSLQMCSGGPNIYGQLKFSPRGDKVANLISAKACEALEMFDFDIATGAFSNMISITLNIPSNVYPYGLSFSPDGSNIYVTTRPNDLSNTNSQLLQFHLLDTSNKCGFQYATVSSVNASKVVIGNAPSPGSYNQMQLGIDGRLYIAHYNSSYTPVVNWPNVRGNAATLDNTAINLGATSYGIGLPNFIESYFYDSAHLQIITADTSICLGDSVQLRAEASAPVKWAPSTALSCTDCLQPKASPPVTTKYYLTDSINGCFLDSVEISIGSGSGISVSADTSICKGDTAQLMATGASNFLWSPGATLSDSAVSNPHAFPGITTIYTVRSLGGCADTERVTITVMPAPSISITPDTVICAGDSLQLAVSGGSMYQWFPAASLSDSMISSPFAKPTTTTDYQVVVSNTSSCTDTGKVKVTVIPAPSIILINDTFLCLGDSIQLDPVVSNTDSFFWTSSVALSDSTIINPFVKPVAGSTFKLMAFNQNLCRTEDSIKVNVVNSVNIQVTNDTTICKGDAVQLMASGANTYLWTPSVYLDDSVSANPMAIPDNSMTYVVEGSVGNCVARDSIHITVLPAPDLLLSNDTTICQGDMVQLHASGGDSLFWFPGKYLDDSTLSDPFSIPDSTVTYYVTAFLGNCISRDSVTISVQAMPELVVSNDTTICAGEAVALFATGATTYQWFPSTYLDSPLIATPISTPADTIQYTIRGVNGSCIIEDTVNIYVKPSPSLVVSNDTIICEGRSVMLLASGADLYRWEPTGGLSDFTIPDPTAFPAATTTYHVYGSNSLGCTDSDSVFINIIPKPLLDIDPTTSVCVNQSVVLTVKGAATYLWSTGSTSSTISVLADSTRNYFVIGYNNEGCAGDTAFIKVIADSTSGACRDLTSHLFVPSAFSPNGNGTNDLFIYGFENIGSFRILIYNRWGEELFRSNNINHFWNGTYKGKPVQDGAYLYIIDAVGLDWVKYSLHGTITVLR